MFWIDSGVTHGCGWSVGEPTACKAHFVVLCSLSICHPSAYQHVFVEQSCTRVLRSLVRAHLAVKIASQPSLALLINIFDSTIIKPSVGLSHWLFSLLLLLLFTHLIPPVLLHPVNWSISLSLPMQLHFLNPYHNVNSEMRDLPYLHISMSGVKNDLSHFGWWCPLIFCKNLFTCLGLTSELANNINIMKEYVSTATHAT